MTKRTTIGGVSTIALAATATVMLTGTAHAAGTVAGTSITNTVTLNYAVGGVSQTAVNASNTFLVDRKVTLAVAEIGSATTVVAPGQTAAVTSFTVTNTTNAALDLGLAITQPAGGAAAHGGTDNSDVAAPALYIDTNGNGAYDPGIDLAASYLDEVAADASRTVFIVANIPAARVTGDVAGVTLTAQARESGAAGAQGAIATETAGGNTAAIDTVFADTAGATDAARDGRFSARDDYTVAAAALTITKTSRVISDSYNTPANAKAVPGATIEYCIQVANSAGGATATNVAISDPLPATTTYLPSFGTFINGTATGGVCAVDGTAGGTFAGGTVSATLPTVAPGTTRTLYFRAAIN